MMVSIRHIRRGGRWGIWPEVGGKPLSILFNNFVLINIRQNKTIMFK